MLMAARRKVLEKRLIKEKFCKVNKLVKKKYVWEEGVKAWTDTYQTNREAKNAVIKALKS
jgi:hypothetical protein